MVSVHPECRLPPLQSGAPARVLGGLSPGHDLQSDLPQLLEHRGAGARLRDRGHAGPARRRRPICCCGSCSARSCGSRPSCGSGHGPWRGRPASCSTTRWRCARSRTHPPRDSWPWRGCPCAPGAGPDRRHPGGGDRGRRDLRRDLWPVGAVDRARSRGAWFRRGGDRPERRDACRGRPARGARPAAARRALRPAERSSWRRCSRARACSPCFHWWR